MVNQFVDCALDQRILANIQHRFRRILRDGMKASSQSSGKNHRFHMELNFLTSIGETKSSRNAVNASWFNADDKVIVFAKI